MKKSRRQVPILTPAKARAFGERFSADLRADAQRQKEIAEDWAVVDGDGLNDVRAGLDEAERGELPSKEEAITYLRSLLRKQDAGRGMTMVGARSTIKVMAKLAKVNK